MAALYTIARYWLVDHPTISQYEWKTNETPGASPLFVAATVATYLTLTLSLQRIPLLPNLPPAALRFITAAHSLTLCLLSLLMAVGCTLSALHQTPPRGPTFFWAHVFYFSKILEFFDTLLILLSGSRSRRLSFLHVYHHGAVVMMCHVWLAARQSLFPVALVTNAAVHVVMYAVRGGGAAAVEAAGDGLPDFPVRLRFLISGWMLRLHFSGSGCEGIRGWCFNAVFNGTLLALFVHFHFKSYANKNKTS